MHSRPPRPRPARPVADAAIESLLERLEGLAKGWLLTLVEQEPLASAPAILAAELSTDGPPLCAAVLRALGSDAELERIAPGGELERLVSRAGELAGARTAEQASRAVEALRAVIWQAVMAALPDPDADQVARIAERLSLVSEAVRGAALRREAGSREDSVTGSDWRRALQEQIAGARRDGTPLSLLLIELEDAQRMLAAESAQHAAATFDRVADVVRAAARPGDVVVYESEPRAWVIAPGTGRAGALALGSDLSSVVGATESWRGAPLRASVGVAVLGEDANDSAGLIEAAEEARFAAAARGIAAAAREIEITRMGPGPSSG